MSEAPPSGQQEEPRKGPAAPGSEGGAAPAPPGGVVQEAVGIVEALADYLTARFRLETRRVELRARDLLAAAILIVCAAAVVIFAISFLSWGASLFISARLGAPYAGPLIVGGVYLLIGVVLVIIASKRAKA